MPVLFLETGRGHTGGEDAVPIQAAGAASHPECYWPHDGAPHPHGSLCPEVYGRYVSITPAGGLFWANVLCCAVLCCAVLCCAVLCCAVLCCAGLCCAVLCCAVLCCAVLCCAVMRCAVLCCAVLCCSVLRCAVLCSRCADEAAAQSCHSLLIFLQIMQKCAG